MRLALVGYGRMGRAVERIALEREHEVVARLGPGDEIGSRALRGAEVAVEFTHPKAAVENIERVVATGTNLVVGTTGWWDRLGDVTEAVRVAGTGLIHAPNFSMGVHLFFELARALGAILEAYPEYDLHVREEHHRHKVDQPSGTAHHVADILVDALSSKSSWASAPPPTAEQWDPETLWVTTVRSGEIPGTHVVGLEGPDDKLQLRHEARGQDGFARGAVEAAEWIQGRTGVFTLDDLMRDRLGHTRESA